MNATIKPLSLLLENIVQDKMGHDLYGIFAALNALSILFLVLLDFGINQFLTRELSSNPTLPSRQLSGYFSLKMVLAFIYPFFMIFVGWILGYTPREIILLGIISAGYSLFQLIMYLRAKFQATQRFNLDSFSSVADKSFLIIFTLILIPLGINLQNYVGIRFLSILLTLLIVALFARKLFLRNSFILTWDLTGWKQVLKQTYPFALITVLYSVHDKIDQVMIERMLGDHASGLYAASYRWLDAFMMYLWVLLPMFFARFSYVKNDSFQLSELMKGAQVVIAVPLFFITAFVWFYGQYLFYFFKISSTPAEIIEMTYCLKVLFISVMIHAFLAPFGTLLSAAGGEYFLNRMMMFSILINVGLNIWLIPVHGIAGAAWATSASTLFLSLAYVGYILYTKKIQIDISLQIKLFMVAFIQLAVFALFHLYGYSWWQTGIIGIMSLTISIFSTGLYKLVRKS